MAAQRLTRYYLKTIQTAADTLTTNSIKIAKAGQAFKLARVEFRGRGMDTIQFNADTVWDLYLKNDNKANLKSFENAAVLGIAYYQGVSQVTAAGIVTGQFQWPYIYTPPDGWLLLGDYLFLQMSSINTGQINTGEVFVYGEYVAVPEMEKTQFDLLV